MKEENNMFDLLVQEAITSLNDGKIKKACLLLEEARTLADLSAEQRTELHDLGNEIQKQIFIHWSIAIETAAEVSLS